MILRVAVQLVRGFCIGCADVVPGVSGGTIALVLGIYERLLANVRTGARALGALVRLDLRSVRARLVELDWVFLVSLLAGVLLAVVTLARVLSHLLEEQPVAMAGLFFGLVVGSILVASRMVGRWDAPRALLALGVGAAMFVLLGIGSGTVADPPVWLYFLAGMVAICAMILPGVSGAFLLLMVGMYQHVLDAVSERDLFIVAVVAAGAVAGLAVFSQVLHWALQQYRATVLAAMVGLLLGSLRILWPWPNGVGSTEGTDGTVLDWPSGEVLLPVLLALVGFAVVVGLTATTRQLASRAGEDELDELRA